MDRMDVMDGMDRSESIQSIMSKQSKGESGGFVAALWACQCLGRGQLANRAARGYCTGSRVADWPR
jgi:hypothetical protein